MRSEYNLLRLIGMSTQKKQLKMNRLPFTLHSWQNLSSHF